MSASDNDSDVSEDGISLTIDFKGSKDCNVSVENMLGNVHVVVFGPSADKDAVEIVDLIAFHDEKVFLLSFSFQERIAKVSSAFPKSKVTNAIIQLYAVLYSTS